jgi:Holliday junction resolvase RusA-like endonuclease
MMVRLPTPPSTNNLYFNLKRGGRHPTDKYKAWQQEAGYVLNRVHPQQRCFGAMKVQVALYVPRKPASRDIDNFCKGPLDLLVKHGVIADDKHIERLTVERHDAADILVSVEPYSGR